MVRELLGRHKLGRAGGVKRGIAIRTHVADSKVLSKRARASSAVCGGGDLNEEGAAAAPDPKKRAGGGRRQGPTGPKAAAVVVAMAAAAAATAAQQPPPVGEDAPSTTGARRRQARSCASSGCANNARAEKCILCKSCCATMAEADPRRKLCTVQSHRPMTPATTVVARTPATILRAPLPPMQQQQQQLQQQTLQQQPMQQQAFPPLGLGSGFGGFSPQTLQPLFLGFQSPQQAQLNVPRLPQQPQPNLPNQQMLMVIAQMLAARQRLAGAGPQQPLGGPS